MHFQTLSLMVACLTLAQAQAQPDGFPLRLPKRLLSRDDTGLLGALLGWSDWSEAEASAPTTSNAIETTATSPLTAATSPLTTTTHATVEEIPTSSTTTTTTTT
ncbi:hypothetical protein CLAIMM_10890, partial [Cladophialophora immunda]